MIRRVCPHRSWRETAEVRLRNSEFALDESIGFLTPGLIRLLVGKTLLSRISFTCGLINKDKRSFVYRGGLTTRPFRSTGLIQTAHRMTAVFSSVHTKFDHYYVSFLSAPATISCTGGQQN